VRVAENKTVQARDSFIVETEQLCEVIGGFVSTWNRQRPPESPGRITGRDGTDLVRASVSTVTAVDWLTQESGISGWVIKGILSRRTRHTELRVADPLVAAAGCPEAFYDGRLEIRDNPAASAATRAQVSQMTLTGDG